MAKLEFPDQPRPGADVHRTRPRRAVRDIAASLGITERSAHGIVAELAEAGYVVKQKDGRRNRYQIPGTSRSRSPLAGIARSARSWPFLPAPTRRRDRPEGPRKPPQARHIAATVEPGPAGATSAGTLHGRQPPPHYLHAARPSSRIFAAPSLMERAGARMSSPSQPARLSNHQRNTLRQIFQHPAGHNIEWRAVLSLLAAVGSAEERHDGKVA